MVELPEFLKPGTDRHGFKRRNAPFRFIEGSYGPHRLYSALGCFSSITQVLNRTPKRGPSENRNGTHAAPSVGLI